MSYRQKSDHATTTLQKSGERLAEVANAPEESRKQQLLDRINRFAASQNYARALDLLSSAGREPQFRNALGVCLLRMGRTPEAVRVFRELVLQTNCTWMRRDLPISYKLNYATALLLGGHPQGCLELLAELNQSGDDRVLRLREAIGRWEKTLTRWQRFNWRFGRIEPRNCRVPIDFVPGEFENVPDANFVLPAQRDSGLNQQPAAVRTAV